MKKSFFTFSLLVCSATQLFAQNTARTDINQAIQNWMIPTIALLFIVGTVLSILHNMDGIRGKQGADQKEAWMNVFQHVIYILIGITVLYFVANKVSSINFSV